MQAIRENQKFRINQKRFHESLEENNKEQPTELPNVQKATEF